MVGHYFGLCKRPCNFNCAFYFTPNVTWHFVQAFRLLCQTTITDAEIELADAFLSQFCCRIENLYGKKLVTPNMHLHCHLKKSLYDCGSVCTFSLFSYKRYNGTLEIFPSNNRSIEMHLMQRFIQECALYTGCQYLVSYPDPWKA